MGSALLCTSVGSGDYLGIWRPSFFSVWSFQRPSSSPVQEFLGFIVDYLESHGVNRRMIVLSGKIVCFFFFFFWFGMQIGREFLIATTF